MSSESPCPVSFVTFIPWQQHPDWSNCISHYQNIAKLLTHSVILKYLIYLDSYSHEHWLMVFHWSLSDSKSPQVFRTLLSILVDLNNAVVWTVSTPPVISKSSSPCTNHLVTVPRAPIIIGITVTFMFHSFFNSLTRSRYLSFFSLSLSFTQWSAGTAIIIIIIIIILFMTFSYHLCQVVFHWSNTKSPLISNPVGLGCRIHRWHLCREEVSPSPSKRMSWIWH